MKTIRISIIAMAMVFAMQIAHAQVRIGFHIGTSAPYHRAVVERPYGYYHQTYYPHRVYYARPVYHRYYAPRFNQRRW